MNQIDESLRPLFERAEREGLWFFCLYRDLWFSPEQLRSEQANGNFRWGAVHWKLRHPSERRQELQRNVESAQAALNRFEKGND